MPHPAPHLTARQTEILRLACEGKHDVEIAAKLGVSVNTVRVQIVEIRYQLGLTGTGARGFMPAAYALGRADEAASRREGEA